MNLKPALTALAAAAVALGVAACGGSSTAPGVVQAPSAGATSTTIFAASTPKSGSLAKEPTIKPPSAPAPKQLVVKDLVKGTGPVAKAGDEVAVNYVGELYSNGKVFDSSWKDTPGKAFVTALSTSAVIPGWVKGIPGMRVGGRRELIIPPALAYGSQGSGTTIPKNATLIFVVDLLKVSK